MTIRTAAAALCVAVLLGGCSAEAEGPEPLPPVATVSPTAVALPVPSEAAAETPQGAAAFARYYLELVNEGFRVGDAAAVRQASHPECDGCNNLISAIEQDLPPKERIAGGEFTINSAEAPPLEGENALVDLLYAISEVRVLDDAGTVLRTTPAEKEVGGQLRLVRERGGWIVRGFRNVSL